MIDPQSGQFAGEANLLFNFRYVYKKGAED